MYTAQEAAHILGPSENSVITAIRRGEIPARRFGRVYRIPRVLLDRLAAGSSVKGESGSGWPAEGESRW